jgi:stress response protein YsnF
VIHKRTVTEREQVEAELRRERVEIDVDGEPVSVDEEP